VGGNDSSCSLDRQAGIEENDYGWAGAAERCAEDAGLASQFLQAREQGA
jgi:hypothetical protein